MTARVIVESVNVRSSDRIANNIVGSLNKGAAVTITGVGPNNERFAKTTYNGAAAYVSRRFLADAAPSKLTAVKARFMNLIDRTIWDASDTYDAVEYLLGAKCSLSANGGLSFPTQNAAGVNVVDCSGWIRGLVELIAEAVNGLAGATVFTQANRRGFNTHSDGQLWHAGQPPRTVISGADIDGLDLRSGLIFGLNKGTYDWESGVRVFEVDHIVMGVRHDGEYFITQSSGGLGVNRVRWPEWRAANAGLFSDYRIHCADLLALGQWP